LKIMKSLLGREVSEIKSRGVDSGNSQKTTLSLYIKKFGWLLIPVLLLQPVFGAQGHNIIVMGGWMNPINSSNLISGAGSNLVNSYQSDGSASNLSIIGGQKSEAWQVYINRSVVNWPANFVLYVKRTGAGDGIEGINVSGGLSFQAVTAAKTFLFSGTGNVHHIPIQYQLSGVSLETSPNNYNTSVIFTVIP
jgi:hypothetical protein